MNKLKKLISVLIVLMMLFGYVSPVLAASTASFVVRRSATRGSEGYEYWIGSKRVNKFATDGYDISYCLKADANFNNTSYTYNRAFNMKTEVGTIKEQNWGACKISDSKKTVGITKSYEKENGSKVYTKPKLTVNTSGDDYTYSDYNAVLWIIDNMFINVDDYSGTGKNTDSKKQLLDSVFETAINKGFKVNYSTLSATEIGVAQQYALWYFTNSSDSQYHVTKLPTLAIKNGSSYVKLTTDKDNLSKYDYMNAIYIYLIENAIKNAKDYGYGAERGKNVVSDYKTTAYLCSINGSYGYQQPIAKIKRVIPDDGKYKIVVKKYEKGTNKVISDNMKVSIKHNSDEEKTKNVTGSTNIGTYKIESIEENDSIVIKELQAPEGYKVVKDGGVKLDISKKISSGYYRVKSVSATNLDGKSLNSNNIKVSIDRTSGGDGIDIIYVSIYDESITNKFDLEIKKVDADTGKTINGTTQFTLFDNKGLNYDLTVTGSKNGVYKEDINESNYSTTRTYYLKEVSAPVAYKKLDDDYIIKLDVKFTFDSTSNKFVISSVDKSIVDRSYNKVSNADEIVVDYTGTQLSVSVPNEHIEGTYGMDIYKVDESGDSLSGAEFRITDSISGDLGVRTVIQKEIESEGIDTYTIEEITTPQGYVGLAAPIHLNVQKMISDGKYVIGNVTCDNDEVNVVVDEQKTHISLYIPNKKMAGSYKLLVNKVDENGNNILGATFGYTVPNSAGYGSFTFNEASDNPMLLSEVQIKSDGVDEWVISELVAPSGYDDTFERKNIHVFVTKVFDSINNVWDVSDIQIKDEDGNDFTDFVTLLRDDETNTYTVKVSNKKRKGNYKICFTKVDAETGEIIRSDKTEIKVQKNDVDYDQFHMENGIKVTDNIEITGDYQLDHYKITELVSPDGYTKIDETFEVYVYSIPEGDKYVLSNAGGPVGIVDTYIDEETNTVYFSINNSKDSDFYNLDLIKIDADTKKEIEGAKFQIKYPGDENYSNVELEEGSFSAAPIRMTSEGTDVIYLKEVEAPVGYDKIVDELKVVVTKQKSDNGFIVTDCKVYNASDNSLINDMEISIKEDHTIEMKIPNRITPNKYDLEIIKSDTEGNNLQNVEFEVKKPNSDTEKITTDVNGKVSISNISISSTGTDEYVIKEVKADGYQLLDKDIVVKVEKKKVKNDYYIGNVQVIDNDQGVSYRVEGSKIILEIQNKKESEYDMSLRKFITTINNKSPEISREPVVDTTDLVKGTSKTAKYDHSKEPLLVANSDVVVYTLRMYNEGTQSGYIGKVKDDIPEGLEFIFDSELNKKYNWKAYDNNGNETTDVTKAKYIETDYLSKQQSDLRNENNLINAFDYKDGSKLDYRDIQIAFKVTSSNTEIDKIIMNTAEITEETDSEGNQVTDRDSTPNNNKKGEDDIDYEYLKLKYFDLALLKWVSSTIITENGKTTETLTGHNGLENPEPVVKVELNRKKLDQITVKFAYTIKITNEGDIEGYAKEISDYIPQGLKFVAEDNPEWREVDGKIVTNQLENTLLLPGESADIKVVLTWMNSKDNLGLKVNVAEISEDYNKYNEHDIDSTPNNKVEGEDDIDNAPVILSISTGKAKTYFAGIFIVLITLASGIVIIKKFVI